METKQPICLGKQPAKMVCINKLCNQETFMCSDQSCKGCRDSHLKCCVYPYRALKELIDGKIKSLSPEAKQSFQLIEQSIQKICQQFKMLKKRISLQSQYYGLTQNESRFLKELHQNNGKNIKGNHTAQIYTTLKTKSLELPDFDTIKRYMQYKNQQCNQILKGIQTVCHIAQPTIDSQIIDDIKDISHFFEIPISSCKLLYRYSEESGIGQFHSKCDNKPNAIVIARNVQGKILGAFTPCGFLTENKFRFDSTKKSFLFSITEKIKFKAKISQNVAVFGQQQSGPKFSHLGVDQFVIMDQGNIEQNLFLINNVYKSQEQKLGEDYQQLKEKITGTRNQRFVVQAWEVFQLQFAEPFSIRFDQRYLENFPEQYLEY